MEALGAGETPWSDLCLGLWALGGGCKIEAQKLLGGVMGEGMD